MIQLAYEPAYDPYHTAFRMLRLFYAKPGAIFRVGQIKILDFYLAFPGLIAKIDPPTRKITSFVRQAGLSDARVLYGELPSPLSIYRNMQPIQDAAIQTLTMQGHITGSDDSDDVLQFSDDGLPKNLTDLLDARNEEQRALVIFLVEVLLELPFDGPRGLKSRSGLQEHRYDIV